MSTSMQQMPGRLHAMEKATVADVMHAGVVGCPPDAYLSTVARMMDSNRIHCVVVSGIERGHGGEHLAWGLLTDLDLVAARRTAAYARAGEVARTEIATVRADDTLETAAELMVEHRITHLLVVSEAGLPLGVVSTLDVARCLAWGESGTG